MYFIKFYHFKSSLFDEECVRRLSFRIELARGTTTDSASRESTRARGREGERCKSGMFGAGMHSAHSAHSQVHGGTRMKGATSQ